MLLGLCGWISYLIFANCKPRCKIAQEQTSNTLCTSLTMLPKLKVCLIPVDDIQ